MLFGIAYEDGRRLKFALKVALTVGLGTALGTGLLAWHDGFLADNELVYGLASGLEHGLTTALEIWRLALGVALTWGFVSGEATLWSVALLLWTRRGTGRWLPWRLGRFLDWCSEAGLVRKAGLAYQFRHRELQDYLAHQEHGHSAPDATRNARR
ncbi:hypothetical protein [Streptomyces scopuliridis]|uniref:hypothetical protein n=1 Tax=Streptomyces scopuliridis TaxID=452529 RepID=UPI0035DDFF12